MTKASLAQGKQLLELFSGATSEQLQMLIENGDVVKLLLDAPLEKVDRYVLVTALQNRAMSLSEAAEGGVHVDEWVYVWTRLRVRNLYPQKPGWRARSDVSFDVDKSGAGFSLPRSTKIVRVTDIGGNG